MATRAKWGRCLGTGLLMCVATGVPALGQDPPRDAASPRVRAAGALAAALLRKGREGSPTFATLLQRLGDSDLVVYVETRSLDLPGRIQLVAESPTCRHLRVSLRTPGLATEQVAWLAHELRHAIEIANAVDVRDQASLRRLYERIGTVRRHGTETAETREAQEVWTKVLYELRRRPGRVARSQ